MTGDTRRRLALALDRADLEEALLLARRLHPWFGVAKVGLELFSAAGPAAVERLREEGFAVFLDVKLHDIPTTVGRAARVLGRLGVSYLTLHASGGETMLRAGVEGLLDGSREAGHAPPTALGVTVLTSDPDTSAFDARLATASAAGCGGVVCSVAEVARVKAARVDLVTVVPGVRLAGGDAHDQARVATPFEAAAAGADLLVVGRAVTAAERPEDAAMAVAAEMSAATRREHQ